MMEIKLLYEHYEEEYTFFAEDLFTVNKKWVSSLSAGHKGIYSRNKVVHQNSP